MSTTSQPTTYVDLYTDLQNRVRVQTGVTAVENIAKRYVNSALQAIAMNADYKLPWLERRTILITHAPYTTGTVSIADGTRTTVTGVDTAWTTTNSRTGYANARATGKLIFAGSTQNIYNITSVDNATQITLAWRYTESSALSAATYTYFEDEYNLASDFLRPVDYRQFSDATQLALISRKEFNRRYPRPNVSGAPRIAALIDIGFGTSTTPIRRVQLYPYPDTVHQLPYAYVTSNLAVSSAGVEASALSADSDEPNMPLRFRHIIVLEALCQWYRDRRNDNRYDAVKAEYELAKDRMLNDQDIATFAMAQIQPRVSSYKSRAMAPYRQRGGRMNISVNNSFDRMEDWR